MQGLIPQPFIDEIINRTDIVDLIDGHVPLKKMGNSYVACCPFHNEKNPSFNVVEKKQFYHCFGCGVSGNAISFVMNYLQKSFPEAIELLAARLGMSIPEERAKKNNQSLPSLYRLLEDVNRFYQLNLSQASEAQSESSNQIAKDYLMQRGLTAESVERYQLGYAPAAWQTLEARFKTKKVDLISSGMLIQRDDGKTYDRYRQRLMFPIHDRQGRIVGFGGRALENGQKPKYLNSPETAIFQKNRELYGLYHVLQHNPKPDSVIIVEGYLDVVALSQHGILNSVATLGTATSEYHIQVLSKYTKQLIVCFDGDDAGRKAAWRALESSFAHLNSGLAINFIFLPQGHDPDSLVREEGASAVLERIKQAIPLNQYFFETLTRGIDLSTFSGKSQLVNLVKPFLIKMPEGTYKTLLMDELSRMTRIEDNRLDKLLQANYVDKKQELGPLIARTPARVAIALLLQNPNLYLTCDNKLNLSDLETSKQTLLLELIEKIKQNPSITTAGLIECWRNSPLFESLNRLAAWDHQVPEETMPAELVDTIQFLIKQHHDELIQHLLNKARQEGLIDTERHQLQAMLKQRHEQTH